MSTKIILDKFCLRQFVKSVSSSSFIDFDSKEFEKIVNEKYIQSLNVMKEKNINIKDFDNNPILKSGYASFCKHIFIENFVKNLTPSAIEITTENESLIKTAYEARTEKELPVLRRFIQKTDLKTELKNAKYLDIILYSKEQISKENEAMNEKDENKDIDYDFGIISIKPQDVDYEQPMDPITMMRNALGKEEGGSGIPLDREKYLQSVSFWEKHVILK